MVSSIAENFVGERDLKYIPVGHEKSNLLAGNYDLAARQVFNWYDERDDYIKAKGAPARGEVYNGEIRELEEAKRCHWDDVRKHRDDTKQWYDDSVAEQIWAIASEAADVAIVGASELQLEGAEHTWISQLWSGKYDHENFAGWVKGYRDTIKTIRDDLSDVGVDLAEAIMMKSALNEQHYPKAFHPWVLIQGIGAGEDVETFARRFRKDVGPIGESQMFDLMMNSVLGETTLSRAQKSPFGTDGVSPKAIYIKPTGQIEISGSDSVHTYNNLYAHKPIKWLFDSSEHIRFHHDPERADYRYYFAKPEWRKTLDNFCQSGIKEMVVPSGSGFRWNGLKTLSKYLNMNFEHVGQVEDELKYKQYEVWCRLNQRNPDVFEYQIFVAAAKELRLDVFHDQIDKEKKHKSVMVAMDEIIVWYDEVNRRYVPIEKPENESEALAQITKLVSGKQYFVSNTTIVTTANNSTGGEGNAVQLLPMRIDCSDEDRSGLIERWLELYRDAASGRVRWKVTPGGVTLLHPDLQKYQKIAITDDLAEMILPFEGVQEYGHRLSTDQFIENLLKKSREISYLDLPEKIQSEIGIAVGGLSLTGLRIAMDRFMLTDGWVKTSTGGINLRKKMMLHELSEMMKIVVD